MLSVSKGIRIRMRVVIDESIFGASGFLADSEARSRRGFSDFRTVARSSKTASDRCPQLIYREKQSYVIIDVGAVEFDVYLTLFSYHELTGWRSSPARLCCLYFLMWF
jgi:hypothetical protein